MGDILTLFPKPLLDDIYSGNCVPFIGAGFSKNAQLPRGVQMPDWHELAADIASSLPEEVRADDPLQIISYYDHEHRRPNLIRELSRALHIADAQPGPAHLSFARLPFELVVTTNFDFLLETAYSQIGGRICQIAIEETQLSINPPKPAVTLIKMHGDLNHASRLIATELDYDRFIEHHRLLATFVANILITKTPLFIGYSLDDYNFRHIFQIVKDRLGELARPAYALQFDVSAATIKRFERRGVTVIPINTKRRSTGDVLTDLFNDLLENWNRTIASDNARTVGPLEELTKPPSSSTRLCLVLVPREMLPYYRSRIFPLIQQHRFEPILASDLYTDSGSETAVLGSLFERVDLILADLTSTQSFAEFRFGLSQRLKPHVQMFLVTTDEATAGDLTALAKWRHSVYLRTDISEADIDRGKLEAWLEEADLAIGRRYKFEPKRLFDLGEYSASLVASIRHFESVFREVLEGRSLAPDGFRPRAGRMDNLSDLIQRALSEQLISKDIAKRLQQLITLRNRVLHEAGEVKRSDAERALDLIDRFTHMFASGTDPGPEYEA